MVDNSKAVVPYLRTFSNEEKQLLGAMVAQIAPKATNEEKALFLYTAQKKGLDPFTKQIYLVPRWDSKQGKEVHSVQVSIDGLRLMAQRSGKYAGQTPYQWCGPDGKWVDVWLDDEHMPVAAKVGIYRHDFKEPLYSVARFNDYKQTKKDGSLNVFWQKYGPHMIAKCCEALSIRRAFPEETSGFYIPEEMGNPELTYVEETEQDNSAPIVASEIVDDNQGATDDTKPATKPVTQKPTTSTKKPVPSTKTPEPDKNKIVDDLANIPVDSVLWATADAIGLSRSQALGKCFRDEINKHEVKLSDLLASKELAPEQHSKLAKFLDEYAEEPLSIAS